ncbi:MAG: GH3 auxin-responsive promoter family protein [Pseudomonadota bacterium]|nr:hypothetical protein [Pseudomonadales bacterium]MDY6921972.1 GH3 auxin-responsive promoter family protein [Pseudomonadota bacterium]
MTLLNRIAHGATGLWAYRQKRQFIRDSHHCRHLQEQRLAQILSTAAPAPAHQAGNLRPDMDWQAFAERVPVTDYLSWEPWIERQLQDQPGKLSSSPIVRHQPTSGSTSAVKWIPYTRQFLQEINRALMVWIGDLYQRYPGIRRGFHYWSVSWIPEQLRATVDDNVNDDLRVLPWWERWIAAQYMAVPDTVARAATSDDTFFASVAWLVARQDLSLLSVWSPTFALSLLQVLQAHQQALARVLEQGAWLQRAGALGDTPCPRAPQRAALLRQGGSVDDPAFLQALWPDLTLISCWDTASSASWAQRLGRRFAHAQVEGKGLWATEGAVTIPLEGSFPLAAQSHFYEFQDLANNRILPAWELQPATGSHTGTNPVPAVSLPVGPGVKTTGSCPGAGNPPGQ